MAAKCQPLPLRPPGRPAAAHPLLRTRQGGRRDRLDLAALALAVAHVRRRQPGLPLLRPPPQQRRDARRLLPRRRGGPQLAAARAPLRKLKLYVELEPMNRLDPPESRSGAAEQELHGTIGALFSKPAARCAEELRIGAQLFLGVSMDPLTGCGLDELRFGAHHPSEALRVLHVTNCCDFTPAPPGTPSPRLAEMRLRGCVISRTELQGMIDAAPLLATLHLQSVSLSTLVLENCCRLRCPAVTALVLEHCSCPLSVQGGIELDAPRLSSAKVLNLKLGFPIDHIAVAEEDLGGLLGGKLFSKLERLELQGTYDAGSEAPGFAIATLLHCCPVFVTSGSS
ncbi:hypothetical protein C2845_PM07G26070 [Panicum miliaceum]|uniref:F-box/LRR-repeat protein 15/At3g58940/PEG3-like LRR domain-containing protein n=1 Tax=Panicum miliaceum TaxID=4540 RepID=A0A3L6SJ05_PANMI|nr:hypothetical protein C2845_PM07G26070 [Panicum miliaceum]